jgi:prophage regulatory protein
MVEGQRGIAMSKLAQAKALADEWAWLKEVANREVVLSSHFNGATPHQLIDMWQSGKNLHGKPLSKFESQALFEAWCRVFNELPPDDDSDDTAPQDPATSEPELPPDDSMLRIKEVARQTGVSESTIKRMALDGRFPKPMRLSPHRIGWPARDVRAWLEELDGARRKVRS